MKQQIWIAAVCVLMIGCGQASQPAARTERAPRPEFSGMWSDPPATAVDDFCFMTCSDEGIARLNALLDDPANDSRPYQEISREAVRYQREEYIRPRLTPAVAKTFPLDPADDPGFLRCEPWGFARQIFAPHQMEIRQSDERIEIRYAEWDGRRTIYMDDRRPSGQPASAMGFSVGRYEGDALVIETSGVAANLAGIFPAWFNHGDQLRAVERYARTADGNRLEMTVTIEDPQSLRQPLHFRKAWVWAPDEQIFAYTNCERPTEFKKAGNLP
jgi:hypothetical protein